MEGEVLLSDFGVSAQMKKGQKNNTVCGSPCWMAPEVMQQEHGHDTSADIWSLGITLIEPPFHEMSPMCVLLKIQGRDSDKVTTVVRVRERKCARDGSKRGGEHQVVGLVLVAGEGVRVHE